MQSHYQRRATTPNLVAIGPLNPEKWANVSSVKIMSTPLSRVSHSCHALDMTYFCTFNHRRWYFFLNYVEEGWILYCQFKFQSFSPIRLENIHIWITLVKKCGHNFDACKEPQMNHNQLSSAEIGRKKIFWLVRRSKFAQESDEEHYTHLVTLRRHIWVLQSITLLTNSLIATWEITERSQVGLRLSNDRHFKTDF